MLTIGLMLIFEMMLTVWTMLTIGVNSRSVIEG